MAISFFKSKWEAGDLSLEAFFQRCVKDGFQGVELGNWNGPMKEIRDGCLRHQLRLICHVANHSQTVAGQIDGLERGVAEAVEAGAEAINCHLGSDFFAFDDNVKIFQRASAMARETGLPILQETHRGRPLYNLPDIFRYSGAVPEMQLTADISHLMCVHESDLSNRWDFMEKMVPLCRHVHARVGFQEGPQVAHPLAPEWENLRAIYLKFWKMILQAREGNLSITPEAGPPPYMPVIPFSNVPLADTWQVNVAVRDWLQREMR